MAYKCYAKIERYWLRVSDRRTGKVFVADFRSWAKANNIKENFIRFAGADAEFLNISVIDTKYVDTK